MRKRSISQPSYLRRQGLAGARGMSARTGAVVGILAIALAAGTPGAGLAAEARLLRTPDGGIQPQAAVDVSGTVHLIYFQGDPAKGDLFYVRQAPGREEFSRPIRVNSQPGSAIAAGTIRGGQIAVGKDGRAHVAWNGSGAAQPRGPANPSAQERGHKGDSPMLYARMNDEQTGFEPQRNLMRTTFALDGGGTVAADGLGNVYVAWHATNAGAPSGEAGRRLWLARSSDDGKTFSPEAPAFAEPTGACSCCGTRAFADSRGVLRILFRSAVEGVNRDMYLLSSASRGESFTGSLIHRWKINACPMSSETFAEGDGRVFAAWETAGQVYFGLVTSGAPRVTDPIAAPGTGPNRKHPVLAVNAAGETLLAWTEGTGWNRGGALAWQVFDPDGRPTREKGRADGVPPWSLATAWAGPDGRFTIMY